MNRSRIGYPELCGCFLLLFLAVTPMLASADEAAPVRDPKQPVNEAYTAKIKKYTTAPYFISPLVDYLPASKNVPTPDAVLGDIAGAPGILPYSRSADLNFNFFTNVTIPATL